MKQPLNHTILQKTWFFAAILFCVIVVFNSCVTVYDTINNRNFADQYDPMERNLHPEYSVYMKSVNDIRLYFRFFPREFAFFEIDGDSIPKARARLFFRITDSYSGTKIIDSLTNNFVLKGKPRPHFLGYVPLKLPEFGKYIIEVFLTDLNVNQTVSSVIEYQYTEHNNNSSYMFISKHGNPLFYNHVSVSDTFRVRTEMYSQKQLRVAYYKPQTEIPIPPDIQKESNFEATAADSIWVVENPDTALFSFTEQGVYHFANQNQLLGKTYPCFNKHFPYLKTADELIKPLAYLCTEKEMKKLREMTSIKHAVDTFWLDATKDIDKSRELIRVFYNRVQLANYYFTDYKEGWLTDRGMIYIVCGAPAVTKITDEGEYWYYGKGASNVTNFFFMREKHPLFGTTLVLDRSELYARMWYNAITTWRDGRVFSLNP